MSKTKKVNRSAKSGEFVSDEEAQAKPEETIEDTVPVSADDEIVEEKTDADIVVTEVTDNSVTTDTVGSDYNTDAKEYAEPRYEVARTRGEDIVEPIGHYRNDAGVLCRCVVAVHQNRTHTIDLIPII